MTRGEVMKWGRCGGGVPGGGRGGRRCGRRVAFVGVADDEFHGPALAGEGAVHDGLTELLELGVGQVG